MSVAESEQDANACRPGNAVNPFCEKHTKYLIDRAVPPEWAKAAGLRCVDADEGGKLLGFAGRLSSGGLYIPYTNQPGYGRVRLDHEDGARFIAPAGREVPVYLPPGFRTAGAEPVLVAEGPIKALALFECDYNALALGGTGTTFPERHGLRRPNDSWQHGVELTRRPVVVVFDAGRSINPNVARDEARAALALERAGASVSLVMLPLRVDGRDQGPDDFLAAHGRAEFHKLVLAAAPADPTHRIEMLARREGTDRKSAMFALLGDVPFLWSIKERGVETEQRVVELLRKEGVGVTVLRRALAQAAEQVQRVKGGSTTTPKSVVRDGRFYIVGADGETGEPLTNFTAEIVRDDVLDDGVQRSRTLAIAGKLASGVPLAPVRVEVEELADPLWPLKHWGSVATVAPVYNAAAHLRSAIQDASKASEHVVFAHTGWREHRGELVFLHAGGAVGASDVSVRVDEALKRYVLPAVPEDVPGAVRAALSFLEIADRRITLPLLSAVFRAPLQHALYCDSTLALVGETGVMKTTVAVMAMSFFGEFEDHLPVSWTATANSLEHVAHAAKDVLIAIDDFAPARADPGDDMHQKAARVVRAVGNQNSRGRMDAKLNSRPDRPPRGLILSTGEDTPLGESINARIYTVRMKRGDVDMKKLSEQQAKRGRLRHAMLGYILWLKSQVGDLRGPLAERFRVLRNELMSESTHKRIASATAHLLLGLEYLSAFAHDNCVLDEASVATLLAEGRAALLANASEQREAAVDANPVARFVAVLRTLLLQGRVTTQPIGFELHAEDDRVTRAIGWADHDWFYLLPDAAYPAVAEAMRLSGQPLPIVQRTLWKHLAEAGFIGPGDGHRPTRKKAVGPDGRRERVIWVSRKKIDMPDRVATRVDEAFGTAGEREDGAGDGGDDDPDGGPGPGGGGVTLTTTPSPTPPTDHPPQRPTSTAKLGRGLGRGAGGPPAFDVEQFRDVMAPSDGSIVGAGPPRPKAPVLEEDYDPYGQDNVAVTVSRSPYRGAPPPAETEALGRRGQPYYLPPAVTAISHGDHSDSSPSGGQSARPGDLGRWGAAAEGLGRSPGPVVFEQATRIGTVGFACRSTGRDLVLDEVRHVALAVPGGGGWALDLYRKADVRQLRDLLSHVTIVGHELKTALGQLLLVGVKPRAVVDTAVSARLLDGGAHIRDRTYFSLQAVGERVLRDDLKPARAAPTNTKDGRSSAALHDEAVITLELEAGMRPLLSSAGLHDIATLELDCLPVLAQMQLDGVLIDGPRWTRIVDMWRAEAEALENKLKSSLGVSNIHNDDDVLTALRRRGLDVVRTGADALAPYADIDFVDELMRYRRLAAFVNGTGVGVQDALNRSPDGRVRASIHQIGAATGRMSCEQPNLMGLPRDPRIRGCIIPAPGMKFIVADYAAIDLRVAAHVTGDETLRRLFAEGKCPHTNMASILMKTPIEQVSPEQRQRAKPLNFGLLLGMGVAKFPVYARKNFGVSLTHDEAEQFRRQFLETYPGVAAWQSRMNTQMPEELRTESGRISRRFDPEGDYNARLAFPIQGTAADGMKSAMVLLHPHLEKLGARMVLAVHDELIVEAREEHAETVKEVMREAMIAGMQKYVPSVPIIVEPEVRSSWTK